MHLNHLIRSKSFEDVLSRDPTGTFLRASRNVIMLTGSSTLEIAQPVRNVWPKKAQPATVGWFESAMQLENRMTKTACLFFGAPSSHFLVRAKIHVLRICRKKIALATCTGGIYIYSNNNTSVKTSCPCFTQLAKMSIEPSKHYRIHS